MKQKLHILLVEDLPDDAELVLQELLRGGIDPALHRVDSAAGLTEALGQRRWDTVISDFNLPGFSGAEALQILRTHSTDTPFILVSGRIGEEEAVEVMKSGADDFVMKDKLSRLVPAVKRGLRVGRFRQESRLAQVALRENEARFKAIVSNMPGMVFQLELADDGTPAFSYVSEGCQYLLGVPAGSLLRDAKSLFDRVLTDDRPGFVESMLAAFQRRESWNWEGRIHAAGSTEVKWVDLRSKWRLHEDGRSCWEGIVSNITQNKLADLEIRSSRESIGRLSANIESVKEEERNRISREIHDDLGGTLTAIKIMLLRVAKEMPHQESTALERLQAAEALVDTAMEVTRRIATDLRPGILDLGIVAAIEWQAAEFENRMDIGCQLTCAYKEIALDDVISITLFRIFQEALTNIAKHAGATKVDVELEADEESVSLQVHDNGRGIGEGDFGKPRSFGILGMQERARNLGGEAGVRRTRSGTAVMLRLPLAPPAGSSIVSAHNAGASLDGTRTAAAGAIAGGA